MSDLVDRWHAFLDELVGDVEVIEPESELMPSLHLPGCRPLSIVVTDAHTIDDYWRVARQIDREVPMDAHHNDLLIVGQTWHIPGRGPEWSPGAKNAPVAGLLDQFDLIMGDSGEVSPTLSDWCEAPWVAGSSGIGVMHTVQSFLVRPHGDHVYDDGADDVDFMQMEGSWHLALPQRKHSRQD